MAAHMVSVLVIDDDPKITQLLQRAFVLEGYAVSTGGSGGEALERFASDSPDLVVLDILLPDTSGIEVCKQIRARGKTPVLLLTAKDEIADRVDGLDSGADDYLVKPFALEELLARVRALLRRNESYGEVLQMGDLTLDAATRSARRGKRNISLSATEYELLGYLMRNSRRVISRDVILDAVWGDTVERPTNVVDVYIGYLRAKLEADREPRILHTVRGAGYVLREA